MLEDLEDVKGQIFRLVSAQNYLRPNVDGILLVQHLIFEPPSNRAKSSFIWPGRYTHTKSKLLPILLDGESSKVVFSMVQP
jgi:hypothetical protein